MFKGLNDVTVKQHVTCAVILLKRKENYKIKENPNIKMLLLFFLIRYIPTECPSEFKDYQER